MQTDLFKTKKQLIFEYIKRHKYVKTFDLNRYGISIGTSRAMRYARELAQEARESGAESDYIRMMPKEEADRLFLHPKQGIWEYVE